MVDDDAEAAANDDCRTVKRLAVAHEKCTNLRTAASNAMLFPGEIHVLHLTHLEVKDAETI